MISTDSSVLSLESVLDDPNSDMFKEFTDYLHQSYCIENLSFWIAVQDYMKECNQQQKLCEAMINLYIRPNSPQEINIPCDMRQTILDLYRQGNYHAHLFDEAAEAVLELMRVNSFLPWMTSHLIVSSSSSTTSSSSLDNRKSWSSKKGIFHTISTHSLSDSKWFVKLKQSSRTSMDFHDQPIDNHRVSVTSATSSGTRYRSMLKRVKKTLLGFQSDDKHTLSDSHWTSSQR
ncbi:RGS domain-containing protein [Gilbertella persicaria]|uniref:RGS domain-containing protein n=1 Tax=Gilbertella persicaria TaxID=101096 RepID=UPI00221F8C6A|nr:RGS domain-containing protein [Gilbertella persicaria]KAI8092396.1 RGS domain-containing protein [Gilbertella persicaria]